MSKEITIDWKGGSRRIELKEIPNDERVGLIATAPLPLKLNAESLAWLNHTIKRGTNLDLETIESLKMLTGLGILSEIMGYWGELAEEAYEESTDKGGASGLDGFDLNKDGAVDVEDYR